MTLSVDGKSQQVTALGDTVGDVLDAEGIEVGDHDRSPRPRRRRSPTAPGSASASAARSTLSVDGDEQTYWVTATNVDGALRADRPALRRRRSSRSAAAPGIDRGGLALEVATPKRVTVKVGAAKAEDAATSPRWTVRDLLDQLERRGRQATTRSSRPSARTARRRRQGRRHRASSVVTKRVEARGRSTSAPSSSPTTPMFEGDDQTVRAGERRRCAT